VTVSSRWTVTISPQIPMGSDLEKNYMTNVSTVGRTCPSQWAPTTWWGNVVEILDKVGRNRRATPFTAELELLPRRCCERPGLQVEISPLANARGDFAHPTRYLAGFSLGVVGNLSG